MVLHLNGAVSTRDVVALFESLPFPMRGTNSIRVLFDWRALTEWSLEDWGILREARWSEIACPVSQIAMVHHPIWKRQAAMFAAILRRENVLVRSWKPEQIEEAFAWLAKTLHGKEAR